MSVIGGIWCEQEVLRDGLVSRIIEDFDRRGKPDVFNKNQMWYIFSGALI